MLYRLVYHQRWNQHNVFLYALHNSIGIEVSTNNIQASPAPLSEISVQMSMPVSIYMLHLRYE